MRPAWVRSSGCESAAEQSGGRKFLGYRLWAAPAGVIKPAVAASALERLRGLDEWLRHRLRAMRLEQWRRGPTVFRELRKLGASTDLAARVAGSAGRWWRVSG